MEQGTRIVRLGNSVGSEVAPRVATFEEAFGEYSEIRGRGRARRERRRDDRLARKVRRQERIAERKLARQKRKDDVTEAKQERRSARKQRRGTMRIGRRAERKALRQQMRADQQAARMARRMERKRQQQDRRDLVADREMDRDIRMAQGQEELAQYGQTPQDMGADQGYQGGAPEAQSQGGFGQDQGGYAEDQGSYGGGFSDEGGEESYGDDYGQYGGQFSDDYGDEMMDEGDDYEEYGEGDYNYEEDYGMGDEFEEGDYNFEGESGLEDDDDELAEAQSIADKIEWNKKLIQKLSADGTASPETINARNERIDDLKCDARDFVCFDGDYFDDYEEDVIMGADGKMQMKPMNPDIMRRMRKMQRAKTRARRKAGFARAQAVGRPSRPTMVQRGIGAEMSQNRIIVPATSEFVGGGTGTGITAIDAVNDYGYAPTEIKLGFNGESNNGLGTLGQVALGLGIGVVAIMVLKSTKVL